MFYPNQCPCLRFLILSHMDYVAKLVRFSLCDSESSVLVLKPAFPFEAIEARDGSAVITGPIGRLP